MAWGGAFSYRPPGRFPTQKRITASRGTSEKAGQKEKAIIDKLALVFLYLFAKSMLCEMMPKIRKPPKPLKNKDLRRLFITC